MKNTVQLEAITKHPYGKLIREPGDQYEASARDAKILILVGRAKLATPERPLIQQPRNLKSRDLKPGPDESGKSTESKRTYNRRDMKAEDE